MTTDHKYKSNDYNELIARMCAETGIDIDLLENYGALSEFLESTVVLAAQDVADMQNFRNEAQPRVQMIEKALDSARKQDGFGLAEEIAEVRQLTADLAERGYVFDAVKRGKK